MCFSCARIRKSGEILLVKLFTIDKRVPSCTSTRRRTVLRSITLQDGLSYRCAGLLWRMHIKWLPCSKDWTSGACFNCGLERNKENISPSLAGQHFQLCSTQSPLTFTVSHLNQNPPLGLNRLVGGDWTRKNRKARMCSYLTLAP